MDPQSVIRKEGGSWNVYSEDGKKKLGGPYKTKEQAEKRLRQVEHFKALMTAQRAMRASTPISGRARYIATGFLALNPQAFGQEFEVQNGVAAKPFEECGRVAVIHIKGPLEQHPHREWQDYETIHCQAEAAFANATTTAVALCINSPGGSAAGCFELSRALRTMSETSQKPLGVFIDGMACSAAYALACSATAGIFAPPTSTVASLAVYEMIVDQTAADAAMGLKFLFVPSTGADLKLTGNAHIPPTGEMVQHTQAQVDLLTDYFYGLVEEMRGVAQAEIRALRGATLLATQGLDNGLVDTVSDWAGFLAILETSKGSSNMPALAKAKSPWEEAIAALQAAADGEEDEDKKSKAKKMLRAAYSEDKDTPNGDPKPEPAGEAEEEAKAKAEAEEKAHAEAEEEARKAQARAGSSSNELSLAQQVHALQVKIAGQEEATARAALLSQRPDFSAEVRKTMATVPLAVLEQAVKSWPRVTVSPTAAANAAMPGVTPGQKDGASTLRAEETALLDRIGRNMGPSSAQARVEGSTLVLDQMTSEAASARIAEMTKLGMAPKDFSQNFARISQTEFKVK